MLLVGVRPASASKDQSWCTALDVSEARPTVLAWMRATEAPSRPCSCALLTRVQGLLALGKVVARTTNFWTVSSSSRTAPAVVGICSHASPSVPEESTRACARRPPRRRATAQETLALAARARVQADLDRLELVRRLFATLQPSGSFSCNPRGEPGRVARLSPLSLFIYLHQRDSASVGLTRSAAVHYLARQDWVVTEGGIGCV